MTMHLGASSRGGTGGQLRPTGGYTDPGALAIGTSRQPNVNAPTQIIATIDLQVPDNQSESVLVQISPDNAAWDTIAEVQHNFNVAGLLGVTGDSDMRAPVTFEIPAGWFYRFTSSGGGSSTVNRLRERTI